MVNIYTAPGCGPCKDVKEAFNNQDIEVRGAPDQVELVDVTTDEGYPEIDRLGINHIPSAFYNGKQCKLLVDDENQKVIVDCREDTEQLGEEKDEEESYDGIRPSY